MTSQCAKVGLVTSSRKGPSKEEPITIDLDPAKSVFQIYGVSATGAVVCRRRLRRTQLVLSFSRLAPCLVGMEACAGAHPRGREIAVLGHKVRLMPPA